MNANRVACPYCEHDLKVMPQRKKKCPSCVNLIYVKSTPDNREKRLMTEADAQKAEAQWISYHLRGQFITMLYPFGFGEKEIEAEKSLGAKSDSEAVEILLNRIASSAKDLHDRKMAYYQLALLAEEEGRPFHDLLAEAARCELTRYKKDGVEKVEILTAGPGNSCPECEAQAGRVSQIRDVLRLMPLPCPNCTKTLLGTSVGFCRCRYVAAFD